MQNRKLIKCLILLVTLCFLTGCSPAIGESSTDIATIFSSSEYETTATPTQFSVGITYSVDQNGRTVATGATPEGIPVSAVILTNRDLQDPGEASCYEIQIMPFDETDRDAFCGQDWTILESSANDEYYLGTVYYDIYIDSQNRQLNVTTMPEALDLYTANGAVITGLLSCCSEPLEEQEDLPFTSINEAYQEAKDLFTNAGFDISDCYEVYCYPYTWLENSAKLASFKGDDMTEYNRIYPDGLYPEDGAYLLELRRDIDGLPILTGEIGKLLVDGQVPLEENAEKTLLFQRSQALVTSKGVENATIFYDYSVGSILGTGDMISFEAALHTVSQNFFSLNPNDGLFTEIYQPCMQNFSADDEGTITPSYQLMNGTISVEKAELGLLALVKGEGYEHYEGRAIPCWEFLFVWQSDSNGFMSARSECWVAVNALTGEYVPATTSWGRYRMKTLRRRINLLAVICSVVIIVSSCSSTPQEESRITPRNCAAFLAQELIVPVQQETSTRIIDACEVSASLVILTVVCSDSGDSYGELLAYNSHGVLKSTLSLTGSQGNPVEGLSMCDDGESLYVLTSDYSTGISEVLEIASDDLNITKKIDIAIDSGAWVSDFLVMGEDMVLLCEKDIIVYRDGKPFQQTTIPGDLEIEQIVGNEGSVSYLFGDLGRRYFGEWDYTTGVSKTTDISYLNSFGIKEWCESDNAFYMNSVSGIYRLDDQSGELFEVLAWKDTDLPPTRYAYNISNDYILSGDRILSVVAPVSSQFTEPPECQILTHTDKGPSEGKTILTIGGYDASDDSVITYAVYQFNQTNDTYRIEIQDYSELYPFEDMSSYNQALVAILADMTKGKGQDILYGDYAFNYNKLDDNGLLLNMMPYLEKDKNLSEDTWLPSMYSLMAKNNEMYFFFPSFTVYGFMTNQDYFPESDTVTCEDVLSLKQDKSYGGTIFSNVLSADLLRGALLYSMDDYIDSQGKFSIKVEQLDELIQYSRETGVNILTPNSTNQEEAYLLGQQAMQYSSIFCPQDFFRFQTLSSSTSIYVGFPAQQESARICFPGHQIAISSGTKYPDACWEFVKIMMSPEVQQKAIELNSIPVSRAAFESLLEKAQHPEMRTPAENTALDQTVQTAIPAESIAEFRALIDSINAMTYYDTVLSAIIDETCAPCLYGEKTAAEVVNELNERINLYLQE